MPSLGTQVFGPWQVSLWAWVNWLTLKCLGQHRYGAGDHRFFVNKLTSIDNVLPSGLTLCYRRNVYRQLRAGTLEGDSRTPTGVLQSFSQGGALGINLMMLEPWQLVLGGFWNHIMGNQENDPRTPSFWSLSVIKKQSQQLHLSKTRNLTNSIIRLLPLLPC